MAAAIPSRARIAAIISRAELIQTTVARLNIGDSSAEGSLHSQRLEKSIDSIQNAADRMDSEDFKWAVMAIRIQREVGGNLAENSGGPHCFKYGVTTNYVAGVTAVLGDGQVAGRQPQPHEVVRQTFCGT